MSEIKLTYNTAETLLESPLGALRVWATSADHVGITTGDGAARTVAVNRVDYRMRYDIHPESYYAERARRLDESPTMRGQAWQEEPGEYVNGWTRGRGYNPLTRDEWENYRDSHGSESAVKRADGVILPWITEWLTTDDGRALLAAGQEVHNARERETLEREAGEIRARLTELTSRLEEFS